MSSRPQLYALLAGALLTAAVLGLDLADPDSTIPGGLRSLGAKAAGPLLTTVNHALPAPADGAEALAETTARLALAQEALRASQESVELVTSATLTGATDTGHRVVLARVVAVGAPGSAGPERLTLDVGSRDGVALDQSVIAADGLVGRTIRVGRSTSDVLVVGAPDLIVGARTDDGGLLGAVGSPDAGQQRQPGDLTFTAIAFGEIALGERVLTLGSPDNAPFVAGIPIGVVTALDPSTGQVGLTAALDPALDVATLDVVAVIVPGSAASEGE